jgi:hypothetical protein
VLVDALSPFKSLTGRNYPEILAFLDQGQQPARSRQSPAEVTALLAPAFAP